ncbi:MAG: hypothetical protein MI861_24890 [Pirellulales bacterium]|nr:hypothetical protein [Pirellulales bacterium]
MPAFSSPTFPALLTMLGLTKPRAPLTTFQRLDIELLMRRTIEMIGRRVVVEAEVVTDVNQLGLDDSSQDALVSTASREVRRRMDMEDVPLDVQVVKESELAYPSLYKKAGEEGQPALIQLSDETVSDPLRTFMELAYQYSQHYWSNVPNPRPLDQDPRTTNLLPVCYGLGVLASDASLYDLQWSQAGWSGFTISRSGYYNTVELGYALALFARARGEIKPAWSRSLRLDSKATAQQAWRFFQHHQRAGGSLLFDSAKIPRSTDDLKELGNWLGSDDLTFALAAGYALSHHDELPSSVIEAALKASRSADQDLVPVAVRLLAGARQESPAVTKRVQQLIHCDSTQTSLAAVQAAHALGLDLTPHRGQLSRLLDQLAEDAFDLLTVIGAQGSKLNSFDKQICKHVSKAIRAADKELASALLRCLRHISESPGEALRRYIKTPTILHDAMEQLEQSA